ncbi:hypothetical protein DACRYDRAFT_107078 [Dacryopinax primogenitus]|uniref:RBR-type E3 ubiquitin transferase n=1 Tax=Dacryopinax primogenitus (strain DJM 731) TaxID=1858805 RepID=M5FW83_DACPD|nr:uncharacterized protein DACRYDRAFT_107078 [Dacryopinax primogenitus]EJU02141.1 hypothetical protein DACRYDRAFT_107078 [Dacryopinax primogenitus]
MPGTLPGLMSAPSSSGDSSHATEDAPILPHPHPPSSLPLPPPPHSDSVEGKLPARPPKISTISHPLQTAPPATFPIDTRNVRAGPSTSHSDPGVPSPTQFLPAQTEVIHTCQVCAEDLPTDKYSRYKLASNCQHSSVVCRRCVRQYLKNQIEELGNTRLLCPVPECRAEISYHRVKRYARSRVFQRYDALLLRKNLGADPNFIWCKNPKCDSGQVHDGIEGGSVIITCVKCGSKACSFHDAPWHEGLTCAQYDQRKMDKQGREAAVEAYFSKNTKQCPKCNAPIEKISGCDHMTCRPPGGCGFQL